MTQNGLYQIDIDLDIACPEISGHAIEIANVPRPKLFVHKINEKLE